MRKALLAVLAVALAAPAYAELQTATVDGSIRIRANWYMNTATSPAAAEVRWPAFLLPGRATGARFTGGAILSPFSFNEDDTDVDFVEQRTRLGVKADFTDEVGMYIEFDSYDVWGDGSFRSLSWTGLDGSSDGAATDDVSLYQAYVEAKDMGGFPLCLRIGRQEMTFGSGWQVGTNDSSSFFRGLSFDAVRATYATDMFSVDAFVSVLADDITLAAREQDGDITFSGIYASYLGLEDITIDGYWLWVRDSVKLNDTNVGPFAEWLEDLAGLDNYDPTNLHTVGLRGAGTYGAFDFEGEIAYQFGDADRIGQRFNAGPVGPFAGLIALGAYGDDDADFGEWGANLEVGYTFDMNYTPRVFLGGAYFGGEDNRDLSLWEWINPFDRADASISYNRLFSNWEYSEFLANTDESNMWLARGGVKVNPTESTEVLLTVTYFQTLEEFDAPRHFNIGRFRVPIAPGLSFWTQENDSDLGVEVGLYGTYNYSEDLAFNAGFAHLFAGDGVEGQFSNLNGLGFIGGSSDDDPSYLFLETTLKF